MKINNNHVIKKQFGIASATLCASFLLGVTATSQTAKADTIKQGEEQSQVTNNHPDIPVEVIGSSETESANTTDTSNAQSPIATPVVSSNADTQNPDAAKSEITQPTVVKQDQVSTNTKKKTSLKGKAISTKDSSWDGVQTDYDTATHTLTINGNTLANPNPIYKQFAKNATDLQTIKFAKDINLSGSIKGLFSNLTNLTSIEGLTKVSINDVSDMSYLFDGDQSLTSLDLTGWCPENTVDTNHMFSNCTNLEKVFASTDSEDKENEHHYFDTSKVRNMSAMFQNDKKLWFFGSHYKDAGNSSQEHRMTLIFPLDSAQDLSYMFAGCDSIEIFNFDSRVPQATTLAHMFENCANLMSIWSGASDCNYVSDWSYMFANNPRLNTVSLLGIRKLPNSNITANTSHMFYNDPVLIKLGDFQFNDLVDTSYMFAGDEILDDSLTQVVQLFTGNGANGYRQIDKLTNMAHMFDGCSGVRYLDLTKFTTNDNLGADKTDMFKGLTNLQKITLDKDVNLNGTGFMPPFKYTALAGGTDTNPKGKTYTATGLRKFWNNQAGTETFVGTPATYYNVTVNFVDSKTKQVLKTIKVKGNALDPIDFSDLSRQTIAELTKDDKYQYNAKLSTVPLDENGDIQLPVETSHDVTYEVALDPVTPTAVPSYPTDTIVTNVVVHYQDELGNQLAPDETITGKLGGSWNAVPKEIKGYHLVDTKGMATGTISDVRQEVTFVYAKDNVQVPPADNQPVPEPDPNNANKPNKPNQKPHKPAIIDHGTVYLPNKDDNDNDVVGRPTIVKAAYASEKGKDVSDPSVANLPQTGVNVKQNQGALAVGLGAVLLAILGFFGFKRQKEEK